MNVDRAGRDVVRRPGIRIVDERQRRIADLIEANRAADSQAVLTLLPLVAGGRAFAVRRRVRLAGLRRGVRLFAVVFVRGVVLTDLRGRDAEREQMPGIRGINCEAGRGQIGAAGSGRRAVGVADERGGVSRDLVDRDAGSDARLSGSLHRSGQRDVRDVAERVQADRSAVGDDSRLQLRRRRAVVIGDDDTGRESKLLRVAARLRERDRQRALGRQHVQAAAAEKHAHVVLDDRLRVVVDEPQQHRTADAVLAGRSLGIVEFVQAPLLDRFLGLVLGEFDFAQAGHVDQLQAGQRGDIDLLRPAAIQRARVLIDERPVGDARFGGVVVEADRDCSGEADCRGFRIRFRQHPRVEHVGREVELAGEDVLQARPVVGEELRGVDLTVRRGEERILDLRIDGESFASINACPAGDDRLRAVVVEAERDTGGHVDLGRRLGAPFLVGVFLRLGQRRLDDELHVVPNRGLHIDVGFRFEDRVRADGRGDIVIDVVQADAARDRQLELAAALLGVAGRRAGIGRRGVHRIEVGQLLRVVRVAGNGTAALSCCLRRLGSDRAARIHPVLGREMSLHSDAARQSEIQSMIRAGTDARQINRRRRFRRGHRAGQSNRVRIDDRDVINVAALQPADRRVLHERRQRHSVILRELQRGLRRVRAIDDRVASLKAVIGERQRAAHRIDDRRRRREGLLRLLKEETMLAGRCDRLIVLILLKPQVDKAASDRAGQRILQLERVAVDVRDEVLAARPQSENRLAADRRVDDLLAVHETVIRNRDAVVVGTDSSAGRGVERLEVEARDRLRRCGIRLSRVERNGSLASELHGVRIDDVDDVGLAINQPTEVRAAAVRVLEPLPLLQPMIRNADRVGVQNRDARSARIEPQHRVGSSGRERAIDRRFDLGHIEAQPDRHARHAVEERSRLSFRFAHDFAVRQDVDVPGRRRDADPLADVRLGRQIGVGHGQRERIGSGIGVVAGATEIRLRLRACFGDDVRLGRNQHAASRRDRGGSQHVGCRPPLRLRVTDRDSQIDVRGIGPDATADSLRIKLTVGQRVGRDADSTACRDSDVGHADERIRSTQIDDRRKSIERRQVLFRRGDDEVAHGAEEILNQVRHLIAGDIARVGRDGNVVAPNRRTGQRDGRRLIRFDQRTEEAPHIGRRRCQRDIARRERRAAVDDMRQNPRSVVDRDRASAHQHVAGVRRRIAGHKIARRRTSAQRRVRADRDRLRREIEPADRRERRTVRERDRIRPVPKLDVERSAERRRAQLDRVRIDGRDARPSRDRVVRIVDPNRRPVPADRDPIGRRAGAGHKQTAPRQRRLRQQRPVFERLNDRRQPASRPIPLPLDAPGSSSGFPPATP